MYKTLFFVLTAAAVAPSCLGETFSGDLCDVHLAFPPDTYVTTAACVLSCNLELNANNDDAQWIFKCDGGLLTDADSGVVIRNEKIGSPATLSWDIGNTVTVGAGSVMVGALTSVGAITLGAETTWTGNLTSEEGCVDIGVDSTVIGNVLAYGAITLAPLAKTNPGNLESTHGAIDLGPYANVEGLITAKGAITLAAFATDERYDLTSTSGAVSLGANAKSKDIQAEGAITLGAKAVSGNLISGLGAITLGAKAGSGTTSAAGAITIGAGATTMDPH